MTMGTVTMGTYPSVNKISARIKNLSKLRQTAIMAVMAEYTHIIHPFPPFYDRESQILILGSFPSVKSREQMFFYGHPQNRFWKVISAVFEEETPLSIEEKKALLRRNHIALWDVIESCDIIGSQDSSIRNARPTDLSAVIKGSKITRIFTNGKTSGKMFDKYQRQALGIEAVNLPSTSPANAACSVERLAKEWAVIKDTARSMH